MMYRVVLSLVVMTGLWGCSDGGGAAPDARTQSVPLAGAAVETEIVLDAPPLLSLDRELAERLDTVRTPVLLPRLAAHRRDVFVSTGPGWASVAMKGDGLHLSILARTRAEVRPAVARELPPCDGECVRTSRSDAITSVAFQRYGVSYLLDVECERAAADPRCADEAFALGVYEDLVLAGGGQ